MRRSAVFILVAYLFVGILVAPNDSFASVENFTRYAEFETVTISPEGHHLAITQRKDNLERLIVLDRKTMKPVLATDFGEEYSISNIIWASEQYILVQPAARVPAVTDYQFPTGEIGVINLKNKRSELIFGYRAGKQQTGTHVKQRENTYGWGVVLDILPEEPYRVLIQTLKFDSFGEHNELLKLDIRNGRTRSVAKSPVRNGRFAATLKEGVVAGQNAEGRYEVHMQVKGEGFREVYSVEQLRGERMPIAPIAGTQEYLFSDSAFGRNRGLIAWNPLTDEVRDVFRHPLVDYHYSMRTPQHELYAVGYFDHFPEYAYPNPEHKLAQVHARLVETFPDMEVRIINMTQDQSVGVVYVSGATHAGSFFIVDFDNFEFLSKLDARKWLNEKQLADVIPIEFPARDGTKIRGLLTLPPGKEKDLPGVVLVHGGPHGIYDRWGFNPDAQMLAAQGFAVLQVNYRGSAGQGPAFQAKGYGRWGREMQDDVTDATQFVVQQGTIDPERVCIYGGSYGAYSALVGAYREPELYQCAVGLAGIYDLELLFEAGDVRRTLRGVNYLKEAVGDDEGDLQSRSPVHNADQISVPVMLVHGRRDLRAPIEHAERMRSALRQAGNDPVWHVEDREAHGIGDENNRVVVYSKIIDFIKEHTGP